MRKGYKHSLNNPCYVHWISRRVELKGQVCLIPDDFNDCSFFYIMLHPSSPNGLRAKANKFSVSYHKENQTIACGPLPVFAWPKRLEWFSYFSNCQKTQIKKKKEHSHPLVFSGHWFQDASTDTKTKHAQVPYIKWNSIIFAYNLHIYFSYTFKVSRYL